jgi:hypothetical protein
MLQVTYHLYHFLMISSFHRIFEEDHLWQRQHEYA